MRWKQFLEFCRRFRFLGRFVDQVVISGRKFIKSGDSGSLLVTDPGRESVGLLFAGGEQIPPRLDGFVVVVRETGTFEALGA